MAYVDYIKGGSRYSGPIGPTMSSTRKYVPYTPAKTTTSQPAATVQSTTNSNPPLEQAPQEPSIDYDALIAPALAELDKSVGEYESSYGGQVRDIESGAQLQTQQAQNIATQGEREAATATTKQKGIAESAIDEARRMAAELNQGLQARYGGTTGTGRFASEMVGASAMRGIGQMRTNLANTIQAIDDKLAQVKELSQMQILDIQQKANEMKTAAKQNLDSALAQIRSAKSTLMANKVEYAQRAMEWYQNQVASINQRNTALMQDIYFKKQAAEQRLAGAKTTASQYYGQLQNLGTTAAPQWSWVNNKTGTITPVGMDTYTGSLTPENEEDQFIDQG